MHLAARKTTTPTRDPGAVLLSVPIETRPDLWQTSFDLCEALNALIADAFALYLKTKNFQWHISGPHFRDYRLLFEKQATQILSMTDAIAERIRKNGARTLRSVRPQTSIIWSARQWPSASSSILSELSSRRLMCSLL